jgi:hypothetical protein
VEGGESLGEEAQLVINGEFRLEAIGSWGLVFRKIMWIKRK